MRRGIIAAVALITAAVWLFIRIPDRGTQHTVQGTQHADEPSDRENPTPPFPPESATRATLSSPVVATEASAHPLMRTLESGTLPPEKEPQAVLDILRAYLRLAGEYPSAEDNAELMGKLRKETPTVPAPFPAESSRYAADGALLDAWGVPFFFHALSSRDIEVRSAGPDREMYTDDDIVAGNRAPGPRQ